MSKNDMIKDLFSFFKTKYRPLLPLIFSLALLLSSCSSKSNVENFESSSNDSSEILNDESVFISEDLSSSEPDEGNISDDESLKNLFQSTKEKKELQYILSSSLVLGEKTSNLKCVINKKDGYISSYNLISSESEMFSEKFALFENDILYIEDDVLGKVSFKSNIDDFRLYINENYYIFDFYDSAYNVSMSENRIYKYNFLESVLDQSFINGLLSPFEIEKCLFQNGNCTVTTENYIVNQAFGEINIETIYDSEKVNGTLKFDISLLPICEATTLDKALFDDYVDPKCYNISKSIYNLINQNAYEVLTNARIYSDSKNEIYCDISSSFAIDFTNKIPSMSFITQTSGSNISNYEKYIHNSTIYEKLTSEIVNPKGYTILPYEDEYSRFDYASYWNPSPFSITQVSEYTITETENFYIIDFTYNTNDAIDAFLSYEKNISQFGISDIINDKPEEHNNYIVKKGVGKAIIRKNDFMFTEQSIDIEISFENKTYNLIYTSEVISLNEDTNVVTP